MYDCTIRIERLQNGFTVRMTDPDIVKKNNARSGKNEPAPYTDPDVSYAFSTSDEVLEFVKTNLDKALPTDEYSSTFDAAVKDKE